MRPAPLIIACVALLAVGVANLDVHIQPTKTKRVEVPVTRVVTRTKVIHKYARMPDGYMTVRQCKALRKQQGFRNLIGRYGWPAGEAGDNSDSEFMEYPLSRSAQSHATCEINFYNGTIDSVDVTDYAF